MKFKSLILSGLVLALTQFGCQTSANSNSRQQIYLESRQVKVNALGFDEDESRSIDRCVQKVNSNYRFDNNILIVKHNYFGFRGIFQGLVKDNIKSIPNGITYHGHENDSLIFLIGAESLAEYNSHPDENQFLWDVPFKNEPLESYLIHEIGHVFFSRLSSFERKKIICEFVKQDLSITKYSLPMSGHASHFSEYFRFDRFSKNLDKYSIESMVDEQFAEVFTYLVLDQDYKDPDRYFQKKRDISARVLKRFEK